MSLYYESTEDPTDALVSSSTRGAGTTSPLSEGENGITNSPSPALKCRKNDVLLGRGKSNLHHPGNRVFQQLVSESAGVYQLLFHDEEKRQIQADIINKLQSSGGRFLKPISNSPGWTLVSSEEKRQKVAHALQYRVRMMIREQLVLVPAEAPSCKAAPKSLKPRRVERNQKYPKKARAQKPVGRASTRKKVGARSLGVDSGDALYPSAPPSSQLQEPSHHYNLNWDDVPADDRQPVIAQEASSLAPWQSYLPAGEPSYAAPDTVRFDQHTFNGFDQHTFNAASFMIVPEDDSEVPQLMEVALPTDQLDDDDASHSTNWSILGN